MTWPPTASGSSFRVHGELFTRARPMKGELRQLTEGRGPRPGRAVFARRQVDRVHLRPERPRGDPRHRRRRVRARPGKSPTSTALKTSLVWSPDSKSIAFVTSDRKLYTIGADGKNLKELASSTYGPIGSPAWSPDGKLIAYSKTDVSRSSDVYLIPSTGGEEKKITFDSANEANPRFSADGTKVYFVRREGDVGGEARPIVAALLRAAREAHRGPGRARPAADGAPGAGPEMRRAAGWRPGGHAQDARRSTGPA